MSEFKRIIEINGIKMEVDLRQAKQITEFQVGSPVKLLKKGYSDSYETHSAVIVGFDEFTTLPTITVAYANEGYSECDIKFASINEKSKDYELAPLQEWDRKFNYSKSLAAFDNKIAKLQREIDEVETKKKWFVENYNTYFADVFKNGEKSEAE